MIAGQRRPRDGGVGKTIGARCVAVIADCPGGVSDQVLAQELGLSVVQVRRALEGALLSGEVLRVRIPKVHGGGKGYAMPPTRTGAGAAAAPADRAAASCAGSFKLIDGNSRLVLAWGDACIVLPPAVTRGLFRHLDALGGLQNEQQLLAGAAEAGQQPCA